MNTHRSCLWVAFTSAILLGVIGGTVCPAHAEWVKHVGDPVGPVDIPTYLHYKLGIHDAIWGDSMPTTTYSYQLGSWGPTLHLGMLTPGRETTKAKMARLRAARARTAKFDALNLSVTMPGNHWTQLDPAQNGSRACVLLSRQNPTVVISLAVEPVGIEASDDNNSLLAASQEKMKRLSEGAVVAGQRPLATHSIPGVTYQASAVGADGKKVHYSIWVAARNGYNYSLAVYGEERYRSYIDKMMRHFLAGIQPIEPTRVVHIGDTPQIAERRTDAAPQVAERDADETPHVADRHLDGVPQIQFAR